MGLINEDITILVGDCKDANPVIKLVTEFNHTTMMDHMISILKPWFKSVDTKLCTLYDYKQVIDNIPSNHIIIQTCDGTEDDGYPGIGVVRYLESNRRRFTGANSVFYENTTSKLKMKSLFIEHGVPTAPHSHTVLNAFETRIEPPLIIKPDKGYGSLDITSKSIICKLEDTPDYYLENKEKYFVEKYIDGREFTVLVTDNRVYPPIERVFNTSLKFLSFNDYWKTDDLNITKGEQTQDVDGLVATYMLLDNTNERELYEQLKYVALEAYRSVSGNSYGRVDIRYNGTSMYVLEVNSMPSLSFDTETSLGQILTNINNKLNTAYYEFMCDILGRV